MVHPEPSRSLEPRCSPLRTTYEPPPSAVRLVQQAGEMMAAPAPAPGAPSISGLFATLDPASCGLVDKERLQSWLGSQDSAHHYFLARELKKRCPGNDRLTLSEFQALVHRAQRLDLERFILCLDLHKLIAEAVPLGDGLDPLQTLASLSQAPDRQLSQLLEPSRVARSIQAGLEQTHDAREQHLRQTARSALGVDEDAEEKLHGLQLEYSRLLKSQLQAVELSSNRTHLKKVCTKDMSPEEDWIVGGVTGLMDVDQVPRMCSLTGYLECVLLLTCCTDMLAASLDSWTTSLSSSKRTCGKLQVADVAEQGPQMMHSESRNWRRRTPRHGHGPTSLHRFRPTT